MTGKIRNLTDELCSNYPCLPVLLTILSIIFPVITGVHEWLVLLPACILIFAGWYMTGIRHAFFRFMLPALAVILSIQYSFYFVRADSLSRLMNYRETAAVEIKMTVCDPSLCGGEVVLPEAEQALCRVDAIRFSPLDQWHTVDSPIISRILPEMGKFRYGDRITASGLLYQPAAPLLPGTFDYQDYLVRRGIRYAFFMNKGTVSGHEFSWYRSLLHLRDRVLSSMTCSIRSERLRALAAALLFGCRQGVEPAVKEEFIQSGAIHVMTVSGLHVGMFAGAVLFLLIWIPFRIRMLAVPLLTSLYVLATGAQMPSVRALIMLCCWFIPRAFLIRNTGLNSVFLAAAVLLLWKPFQLADAGFQYSFLCVFFLVLATPKIQEWLELVFEKRHWIPWKKMSAYDYWKIRCQYRLWSGLAGCLTAWLCSFALTLYYQGISVPFAAVANLLIIPAAYLAFLVFTIALLPCLLVPMAGIFFSILLSVPLQIIETVCHFFAAQHNGILPVPSGWSIPIGLLALMLLLLFSARKTGIVFLSLLLVLFLYWCSDLFRKTDPELLILYGGRQLIPALVISDPDHDFSFAANLATRQNALITENYLKRRGHRSLSVLYTGGKTRDFTGGMQYLFDRFPVKQFLRADNYGFSSYFSEMLQKAEKYKTFMKAGVHGRVTTLYHERMINLFSEKNQFSFDFFRNESKIHIQYLSDETGIAEIRVCQKEKPMRLFRLPRQYETDIIRVDLK